MKGVRSTPIGGYTASCAVETGNLCGSNHQLSGSLVAAAVILGSFAGTAAAEPGELYYDRGVVGLSFTPITPEEYDVEVRWQVLWSGAAVEPLNLGSRLILEIKGVEVAEQTIDVVGIPEPPPTPCKGGVFPCEQHVCGSVFGFPVECGPYIHWPSYVLSCECGDPDITTVFSGVVADPADVSVRIEPAPGALEALPGWEVDDVFPRSNCPWDLDGDGSVGVTDFLLVLSRWGPNPGDPADFDGDGFVGVTDFLKLLAEWGPCPPDLRIDSVFAQEPAAAGDIISILGSGFGIDRDDICVLANDGQSAGAFIRVLDARGELLVAQVRHVQQNMQPAPLMALRGDGASFIPDGLPQDVQLVELPWFFALQGDETTMPAVAPTNTEWAAGGDPNCSTFEGWGPHAPLGTLEVTIDFGGPMCAAGTQLFFDAHGDTTATHFHFDIFEDLQLVVPVPIDTCAVRICQVLQMGFFEHTGLLFSCNIVNEGGNVRRIVLGAPALEPLVSGFMRTTICQP